MYSISLLEESILFSISAHILNEIDKMAMMSLEAYKVKSSMLGSTESLRVKTKKLIAIIKEAQMMSSLRAIHRFEMMLQ